MFDEETTNPQGQSPFAASQRVPDILDETDVKAHLGPLLAATNDGLVIWQTIFAAEEGRSTEGLVTATTRFWNILGFEDDIPVQAGAKGFWDLLLHPDDRANFEKAVQDHLSDMWPLQQEFRFRHRWLGWRDLLVRGATDADRGELPTLVLAFTDVSETKKTEAELIAAREKAQQASHAKTSFLATMSHEIRTPMNGVLGMANLLATTKLNEEQRVFVNTIQESGKALLEIINDILDFSKLRPTGFN